MGKQSGGWVGEICVANRNLVDWLFIECQICTSSVDVVVVMMSMSMVKMVMMRRKMKCK